MKTEYYKPRLLPLTREYPGYQFYAVLELEEKSSDSCLCYTALCIIDWLKKRVNDDSLIPVDARKLPEPEKYNSISFSNLKSFQINSGFTANTVSLPSYGIWTLRLKEPDTDTNQRKAVPGRFFTTNVGLNIFDRNKVELGIRIDVLDPEDAEEITHAFRPAFVRSLFDTKALRIQQGITLYYNKAHRISSESEWKEFRKSTDDTLLPIIVFSEAVEVPDYKAIMPIPGSAFRASGISPVINTRLETNLNDKIRPVADVSFSLSKKNAAFPASLVKKSPKTFFPIDPDDFAGHAFGYAIVASVTEYLRPFLTKRLKTEYRAGDILFVEPKRYGGCIRIHSNRDKVQILSRTFSKNKSYSFGNVKFDYDARNLEHRELIRSIQDSRDMEAEDRIRKLNDIIAELQEENEKRVRKIDELKAQNREEFHKGELAEQQHTSQLIDDYDEKVAALRKAEARIEQLELENAEARSIKTAVNSFRSMEEMPTTNADVIRYFHTVFGDRIVFTDRAIKTGSKCEIKPEGLWFYLYYMATELFDLHHDHTADVEAQFKAQTAIEVAMGEGNQSRKDNSLMKSREDTYKGREIWAEPHVKLVPSRAGADYQRIYYCFDHEIDRIIVSWIGDHLKNFGTRQIC